MDPRPGDDSGSGGRGRGGRFRGSGSGGRGSGSGGSGDGSGGTSRSRQSRLSAQSTGTRLMQDFNAAAGDGDGRDGFRASSSRWSGREDPGLEESTLGYNRHGVQHNASQNPNLGQDDEVIVMDGVLVGNNSVSVPCYPSNQGYVPASYYGGTASYYAPNLQMGQQIVQPGARYYCNNYMQPGARGTRPPPLPYPSPSPSPPQLVPPYPYPGPGAFPLFRPIAPVIPPAPRFPPQRATPTAVSLAPPPGFPQERRIVRTGNATTSTPARPPPPPTTTPPSSAAPSVRRAFTWPPNKEEDEQIDKVLYGPSDRARLPVFESICPKAPDD